MGNWLPIWSEYARPLLLLKLGEFLACTFLGSALILAVPETYYGETGVLGAMRGGLIFAGLFFVFTAYPIVSSIPVLALVAMRVRSRSVLSLIAGVFMLAYSTVFALMALGEWPISFWATWLLMGAATFLLALWLLPSGPKEKLNS